MGSTTDPLDVSWHDVIMRKRPGYYAVLANSDPYGCASFIKKDGVKRPRLGEAEIDQRKAITLQIWDQLDTTG